MPRDRDRDHAIVDYLVTNDRECVVKRHCEAYYNEALFGANAYPQRLALLKQLKLFFLRRVSVMVTLPQFAKGRVGGRLLFLVLPLTASS